MPRFHPSIHPSIQLSMVQEIPSLPFLHPSIRPFIHSSVQSFLCIVRKGEGCVCVGERERARKDDWRIHPSESERAGNQGQEHRDRGPSYRAPTPRPPSLNLRWQIARDLELELELDSSRGSEKITRQRPPSVSTQGAERTNAWTGLDANMKKRKWY